MPPKKTSPKQKPKPSKEVLAMVEVIRAKKASCRRPAVFNEAAVKPVKEATEEQVGDTELSSAPQK